MSDVMAAASAMGATIDVVHASDSRESNPPSRRLSAIKPTLS